MNPKRTDRPSRILPPRASYADEQQLIETLATVVRAILIRRQQAVVQSRQSQQR
jgi:hypothetical protein